MTKNAQECTSSLQNDMVLITEKYIKGNMTTFLFLLQLQTFLCLHCNDLNKVAPRRPEEGVLLHLDYIHIVLKSNK